PVHQLQQYYREGVLDNCYGKWSALWDCLYLKTKPSSQLQIQKILTFISKYVTMITKTRYSGRQKDDYQLGYNQKMVKWEILEAREKAESHIWTFRTPEEAQAYWKQEFGHLNGRESK
ncbi:hypothetical protein Gotur_027718, partial [Gossypium turneri]